MFNVYILLCFEMFSTTPIALMKTTSDVLPAEMNGNGSPVGGIEPVMTCYCTENFQVHLPNLKIFAYKIDKSVYLFCLRY